MTLTEVVLQIMPEASAIRVIGWLPDWDPVHELRVHELCDVEWVDEEIELAVARKSEVRDLVASRALQGWGVRNQFELPRRGHDLILVFVRVRDSEPMDN